MKDRNYIVAVCEYFYNNESTCRGTAKYFNISNSTVYKYLTVYIKYIDSNLHKNCLELLKYNKQQRAIRGGNAAKEKYFKNKGVKVS